MDTIYALLIVFVLYCIVSDWFMYKYGEKPNKYNMTSFFNYQKKILVSIFTLKTIKKLIYINEKSLAKQPIFWISIFFPLFFSAWIEYKIIIANNIYLSFNNTKLILENSAIPIYISALTPTLVLIISNISKTIQTEKQISVAEQKNISDSFYAHNKFIVEELKSISEKYMAVEKDLIMTISSPNILYRKIYNKSSISNGASDIVDLNFTSSINSKLGLINIGLIKLTEGINNKCIKKTNQKIDFSLLIEDLSKVIDGYFTFTNIQCGDVFTQNYLMVKLKNKSTSQKEELDIVKRNASTFTDSFIEYQSIDLARYMIEYVVFYVYVILSISEKILDTINVDINKIDTIMKLKKTILDIYNPITEALNAEAIVFKDELEKIIGSTSTKK
ncbi:MAG: hypothetical protein KA732_00550 [Providencia sp.]|uniref:hypothetical protein n=1 Tax=Providencia sp. TaxID=589 RepID=UPI001B471B1D|nr:hypothetical protein [Providencia sp.]MBP6079747.1 hypothetical protein [Providencia sp.]